MKIRFFILLLFITVVSNAQQTNKQVNAVRIENPLKIDGDLQEQAYKIAAPATDFYQLQPENGDPAFQPSKVWFFYDKNAVYVGGMLYDSAPDSIFNYLSQRDEIGPSDYFGVYFDPYNQGQLAYGFFIIPSGVQTDIKAIKRGGDHEDSSWDAVWQSATQISDTGWSFEMRIPYSALRFPNKEEHVWGLNMFRNIRRYNSNNSWSFVDRKISGFIHQQGELTGISGIDPPVRLSLSPYVSSYVEFDEETSSQDFLYKGGLDVKFGLSESFTLDMMLIPDFGQVQSDDKRLNLSPFEIYYSEKRQFFNEGTELFARGDVFYSRRIGAKPKFSGDAEDDLLDYEIVDNKPSETQLVNATKISGRTKNDVGIGILNAVALPSHAVIKDTISESKRNYEIQPLTNYNVTVFDKSLKNNSYVSLVNTNMVMANSSFYANVTATEFQLRDKNKKYALKGKGGFSTRGRSEVENGYFLELEFNKNSGKLRYGLEQEIYSDKYNPNDLGYLQRNNIIETSGYIEYQIIEPYWILNEWNAGIWSNYQRMYNPADRIGNVVELFSFARFRNNYHGHFSMGYVTKKRDYFETRTTTHFYLQPSHCFFNLHAESDWRKAIQLWGHMGGFKQPTQLWYGYWPQAGINVRIGRKFKFLYKFTSQFEFNDKSFMEKTDEEDTIYFANRNSANYTNVFNISYAINANANFSLRARHYCSNIDNQEAYTLRKDGTLSPDEIYVAEDKSFNSFNVDMVFRWVFAPGSEFSFVWKNAISKEQDYFIPTYAENYREVWRNYQTNTISLKILYYLDYNRIRKSSKNP